MSFALGQRIVDASGARGTVRYVGPVATSKTAGAVYVGIEWDDATRGKNDGKVVDADGCETRYFTCRAGAGSFLKAELVGAGCSFVEALRERYVDVSAPTPPGSLVGLSGRAVPIMLVGDAQVREQQALSKLTNVVLRGVGIATVGGWGAVAEGGNEEGAAPPPPSLSTVCPRVREVDLRGNILRGWRDLAALGSQLPLLSVLNVSDNVLPHLSLAEATALGNCFPRLRTLIVSETGLDRESLQRLHTLAPALEELHACSNGLTALIATPPVMYDVHDAGSGGNGDAVTAAAAAHLLPPGLFPRLRTLNLSSNPLTSWGHVFAVSALPCLTTLLCNDCGLTEAWPATLQGSRGSGSVTGDTGDALPFASLEHLSITGSRVSSTWALDALDDFPSLSALRLTNTDLMLPGLPDLGPVEARQVIIARCSRIAMLNGSEVRLREREDAEKAHARRVGEAFAAAEGVAALTDIFGVHSIAPQPEFNLQPPPGGAAAAAAVAMKQDTPLGVTLTMSAPTAFQRGADTGVIRAAHSPVGGGGRHLSNNRFVYPPIALHTVSAPHPSAHVPPYVALLDPWALGASAPAAAGRLQARLPRYFLLAAK